MPNWEHPRASLTLHCNHVGWPESFDREFDPAPQPLPGRGFPPADVEFSSIVLRSGSLLNLGAPFRGPIFLCRVALAYPVDPRTDLINPPVERDDQAQSSVMDGLLQSAGDFH